MPTFYNHLLITSSPIPTLIAANIPVEPPTSSTNTSSFLLPSLLLLIMILVLLPLLLTNYKSTSSFRSHSPQACNQTPGPDSIAHSSQDSASISGPTSSISSSSFAKLFNTDASGSGRVLLPSTCTLSYVHIRPSISPTSLSSNQVHLAYQAQVDTAAQDTVPPSTTKDL